MAKLIFPNASKRYRSLALPFLLCIAGCNALNTTWVQPGDTYDAWKSKVATLPIEVHGRIPGLDEARTAAMIPAATTMPAYAAHFASSAQTLADIQRVVLYVGGMKPPVADTFCGGSPAAQLSPRRQKVLLASALCDGRRLLETDHQLVGQQDLTSPRIGKTISRVKSRLLYGIPAADSQIAPVNTLGA